MCVWWNREFDKTVRIRRANFLNGNTVKLKRHFWNTKGRRSAQKKTNTRIGKLSARELIHESMVHWG
jgi:hypothetical protein